MAKKKISEELQDAILQLPNKEKNKLLIRLINKDDLLIDQLQYKLLENTEADLVYRRNEVKEYIGRVFGYSSIPYFKDLHYYVRDGISKINRYYKVTKDKKGELELLIYLYLEAKESSRDIKNKWGDQMLKIKFKEYSYTKIAKMQTLLEQIHEDFRVEFDDDLTTIKAYVNNL